jgi:hypothetical protein
LPLPRYKSLWALFKPPIGVGVFNIRRPCLSNVTSDIKGYCMSAALDISVNHTIEGGGQKGLGRNADRSMAMGKNQPQVDDQSMCMND